jgi:SAM-dependent methyltransferase
VITGERVVTPEGGFGPTWQRHVAAYRLAAGLLPEGRVLDLGCGVGHSFHELDPRQTVGVDLDPDVLAGQDRETVAADMRELPFADGSFASVLSVQSLEHVPDPHRVAAEAARVVEPGGVVVFITPNRLTFGRPDEIVDPYHWIEFDPAQLRSLCLGAFEDVEVLGLMGSERYVALWEAQRRGMERVLRLDVLGLRKRLSKRALQRLYDASLTLTRRRSAPVEITPGDFTLAAEGVDAAMDLVAVCRRPRAELRLSRDMRG